MMPSMDRFESAWLCERCFVTKPRYLRKLRSQISKFLVRSDKFISVHRDSMDVLALVVSFVVLNILGRCLHTF